MTPWAAVAILHVVVTAGLIWMAYLINPRRVWGANMLLLAFMKGSGFLEIERWFWMLPALKYAVVAILFALLARFFLSAHPLPKPMSWRVILIGAIAEVCFLRVLADQAFLLVGAPLTLFHPENSIPGVDIGWRGIALYTAIPSWFRIGMDVVVGWPVMGFCLYLVSAVYWARRCKLSSVVILSLLKVGSLGALLPRLTPLGTFEYLFALLVMAAISGVGALGMFRTTNDRVICLASSGPELAVTLVAYDFWNWFAYANPLNCLH